MTQPIQFTLVVGDFGVKYVGKEHVDHLIQAIESKGYEMKTDCAGKLHCDIALDWDYEAKALGIAKSGYREMFLFEFNYGNFHVVQSSSCRAPPKI